MAKKQQTKNTITIDNTRYTKIGIKSIEENLITRFLYKKNSELEVFALPNRRKICNPTTFLLQTTVKSMDEFRYWVKEVQHKFCNTHNGQRIDFYIKM